MGKVIKPDIGDEAESTLVPPPETTPIAEPKPQAAPKVPPVAGKPDPNAPLPLSERAAEAAERAKRALADEAGEDMLGSATAAPVGQPVTNADLRRKAASQTTPAAKCLAGC